MRSPEQASTPSRDDFQPAPLTEADVRRIARSEVDTILADFRRTCREAAELMRLGSTHP